MIDSDLVVQLKGIFWTVFLPPNGLMSLALGAILLACVSPRWQRKGAFIALLSLVSLYLVVSPPGSRFLMQLIESRAGLALDQAGVVALMAAPDKPGAIVILTGGTMFDDRGRPRTTRLSPMALERTAAGARIARWSGLPILTTGGAPFAWAAPEATVMAQVLRDDFSSAPRWTEIVSRDTAGNALYSARLLKQEGITHIVLVTQAFHMLRARLAFEAVGLRVTPAPAGFLAEQGAPLRSYWRPEPVSMTRGWLACHELFGNAWYWLRRQTTSKAFTVAQ